MMITKIEQKVLERFRKLSVEKQEDVLTFLALIDEQDLSNKPTDAEIVEAKRILSIAKQKALYNSAHSVQDLWTFFQDAKNAISEEYEMKKD